MPDLSEFVMGRSWGMGAKPFGRQFRQASPNLGSVRENHGVNAGKIGHL
jgi:hypothetical protein